MFSRIKIDKNTKNAKIFKAKNLMHFSDINKTTLIEFKNLICNNYIISATLFN